MYIIALSSSRAGNSGYLEPALPYIRELLGERTLRIAFIPFASVGSYEAYCQKVADGLKSLSCKVEMINPENPARSILDCDVIMTGGGNTFKLLHDLYKYDLIKAIRGRVLDGTPYIGWSAGANILGKTIRTTNDMPIIQPESFVALDILPFQINPHYFSPKIPGFNGETRDDRIEEFLLLNHEENVVALPEGSALTAVDGKIVYNGLLPGYQFYYSDGIQKEEFGDSFELEFVSSI